MKHSSLIIERFAAGVCLLLILPTLLLVAIIIKQVAGGPVIVTDETPVGRRCRFRTTGRGGPSFHFIGRVLRRYSVDEFPGLWNVVRGEITLAEILNRQ